MLREIVGVAREHEVDAVLVAGDLYDTAAPSAAGPAAGRPHAAGRWPATASRSSRSPATTTTRPTLDAYRPLAGAAGITLVGSVRTADRGGVVEFTARSTGERATVAVLPFLSQRYAVRAAELVRAHPGGAHRRLRPAAARHPRRAHRGFRDDAVNLVLAHLTVLNGRMGGGERDRAVDLRVRGAGDDLPGRGALRRARPPAPPAADGRPVPGALQRRAARRRLRRAGERARRLPRRRGARHAGRGHRHPDHGRAAPAHGARHGRRAGRRAPTSSATTTCGSGSGSRRGRACATR